MESGESRSCPRETAGARLPLADTPIWMIVGILEGATSDGPRNPPDPKQPSPPTLLDLPTYVRSLRSEPPAVLYHFTSTEGLVGLLNSETLRLTRAVCSNDASEVRHFVDWARNAASAVSDMYGEPGSLTAGATKILAGLIERFDVDRAGWMGDVGLDWVVMGDASVPDPYIGCFCGGSREPGILHWGHYGRGGEGVAIEIDTTRLVEQWRKRFIRVQYDPNAHLFKAMEVLESYLLNEHTEDPAKVAQKIDSVIRALSMGMKRKEFEQEDEWRVTWLLEADGEIPVRLRHNGGELVSFVEMPLPRAAIRRVILGTKRDLRRSAGSLYAYLLANGAGHIAVDESEVPFR